ncbi:anthranilate N-methyltransferase-like [Arachis stenosperma]|uniref:anthranilate N-methyltransferase-like n=1 Tax=Arachis stenosperma TaxID=217475 RepID=UPI0025AC80F4|nr:anthranilate N-methyltransferase-like [Arachis stenosperma]
MARPSESDAKLLEHFKLPQDEEEVDGFLFSQMAWSIVVPMALRTTIELGVFDIIAKEGKGAKLSAKDIVDHIGTNNPEAASMLDRLLRLLASHSLLSCSVVEDPQSSNNLNHRLYSLSPVSKYFVGDADGVSLGPSLWLHLDKVFTQSWNELKGAILEGGIPFNRAHGMHVFEYAKIDPRFNEVFNKAMHNSSTLLMKRILDVYKGFDHINKLVDVGGGVGATIKLITSKHPRILGINFDLPHVIECASAYEDGVKHVGGDMFQSVPNGDAIFMKRILHDWGDEECLKILKNCLKAIPNDGKVIVVETMVSIVPEPTSFAKNAFGNDVIMMTQMPGGIERTKQDFMDLAHGSGFSGIRFVCCVSSVWVMEFYK